MNLISVSNFLVFLCLIYGSLVDSIYTSDGTKLKTWWHYDNSVKASPFYSVQVSVGKNEDVLFRNDFIDDEHDIFDSFVYISLPRSGKGKQGYISEDGAEFSALTNLTMNWSSFLYDSDCWVYITTNNVNFTNVSQISIKPSHLNFKKEFISHNLIRIFVPYSDDGYKFSVEFDDDLYSAYNDISQGMSGRLNNENIGSFVHKEPKNALLIFAEPVKYEKFILDNENVYYVNEGDISNLDSIDASVIFFRGGSIGKSYLMPWNYHAKLTNNVKKIYIEHGAYVKGAFQFIHDTQTEYVVSGFGIISGENYVYESDTSNGYYHKITENCHATCVKLLRLSSSNGYQQSLSINGITFVNPPYHSFVVYGDENTFSMHVSQFKMIGAWYWQTDGLELYKNGYMANSFIHSNDDVLKLYHNNLHINNIVVWKNENGPVIQWGWAPHNINNVKVSNIYVIHNKMYWNDVKGNTCVLNSSPEYAPEAGPDSTKTIKSLNFENITIEGSINCAIRIRVLTNLQKNSIVIENLKLESWNNLSDNAQYSLFQKGSDYLSIENNALIIKNYTVSDITVNEINAQTIGKLNFNSNLKSSWQII